MNKLQIDWNMLRYKIANRFFCAELDEAYREGLQEAGDYALFKTAMAIHADIELTKTQRQGYDLAVLRFDQARQVVEERFGIRA
jgi:hypothetical protein